MHWRRHVRLSLALTLLLLVACNGAPADPTEESLISTPLTEESEVPTSIRLGRSNRETGWFQVEIYRQLLQELGYTVTLVEDMNTTEIYTELAQGEDVDIWVEGAFPEHDQWLGSADVRGQVTVLGSQLRRGVLQGYLIDKATADAQGISMISDLADPNKAAIFDGNGNGKADLIGCQQTDVDCQESIQHHLEEYGLNDTVELVSEDYDELMYEQIERYNNDEPILFYTRTPHWAIDRLQPGTDVVWLEVPYTSLPGKTVNDEDLTTIVDVEGCIADLCNLGFQPDDIRAVANTQFLEAHPQVRRLLELVELPLEAVLEQNEAMSRGQNTPSDIEGQARDWISANNALVNDWLVEAKEWQELTIAEGGLLAIVKTRGTLRCGIDGTLRGFSFEEADGSYSGFDADFCRVIATAIFGDPDKVEFVPLDARQRFAAVADRRVDVLFRNTTWTAVRDVGMEAPESGIRLAFGPTTFHDGQRFMVRKDAGIEDLDDLRGKKICFLTGTTSEQNLRDEFRAFKIDFETMPFSTVEDVYENYDAGECDAVTSDMSQLVARRVDFENPDEHTVLINHPISREPLGPVFIEGDPIWRDVITWSIFATMEAENLGVTSDNVEELYEAVNSAEPDMSTSLLEGSAIPAIQRLLGVRGSIGERLGLEPKFAYNIIREVGNYGEIYTRNLGGDKDAGEPDAALERGPNNLWKNGGQLVPPPFR